MIINNLSIKTLNYILQYNEGSKVELQKFSTMRFRLNFYNIYTMSAVINDDGTLTVCDWQEQDKYDTVITINLNTITAYLLKDDLNAIKSIDIQGNTNFAVKLLMLLSELQLSNLDGNNSLSMLFVQTKIIQLLNYLKNYMNTLLYNLGFSFAEYYQYSTGDIIGQAELEIFCNEVDLVREKCDQLEKLIILRQFETRK